MNMGELKATIALTTRDNLDTHIIKSDEVIVFVVRDGVPVDDVRDMSAQIEAALPALKGRYLIVDGMDIVKLKLSAS